MIGCSLIESQLDWDGSEYPPVPRGRTKADCPDADRPESRKSRNQQGGFVADTNELSLTVTVNDLLDAGVHFGHQSKRWNPKMKRFIFAKRGGIYIIDLAKSLVQLREAQRLFMKPWPTARAFSSWVTKKSGPQEIIKEAATRCGHHYIISRWLGGTLTNHKNTGSALS